MVGIPTEVPKPTPTPEVKSPPSPIQTPKKQEAKSEKRTKEKDGRQLLHQLIETGYTKVVEDIINDVGYDDAKIRAKLRQIAAEDPNEYRNYLASLRSSRRQSEATVADTFAAYQSDHPIDQSYEIRRQALLEKIFRIGSKSNSEKAQKEVQAVFPSGNYLVHGTGIKSALAIISDGKITSVTERKLAGQEVKGKGGTHGISFSYDGIGAIPGSPRHMIAFLTSPELVLEIDTKLTVPYLAAENEVQLVPSAYNKQVVAQIEAQIEFLFRGHSDIFETVIGDLSIERDLAKLKTGELKIEDVQSQYTYEGGEFTVNPAVNEEKISAGTIYADYLLRYTEAGRALGKTLLDVTPKELVDLHVKSKSDHFNPMLNRLEAQADKTNEYGEVSIPVEECILLIPDHDLDTWLDSIARSNHSPKAIIVYPHNEGPKIPNWRAPEGHRAKTEGVILRALNQAEVPQPTLPFEAVLGKKIGQDDITGTDIKFLKWEVVADAKEIVKNGDGSLSLNSAGTKDLSAAA